MPQPTAKAIPRPGPPQLLSRDQFADAAVAIIEREGPDAVSIRRLAAELRIGAMTFYGYFRDKEELLDYVVERAARDLSLPPDEGPWRSRLQSLMETIWLGLTEDPTVVLIRSRKPLLTPSALRATEAGMQILVDAGFDIEEAAGAWRLLFTYVFGYAAFSFPEAAPEVKREWAEQMGALPGDKYPLIAAAAGWLPEWMTGRQPFDFGLGLILDGLELRLGRAGH
jgi:AcrR family transcriptional regulator